MTAQEHEDGMRHEPTLSAAEKTDGFAAVMKNLKSRSPDERVRMETQAEEVVLGHEAYALGQEYLDRGDYEAARRWLRLAVGHHIPGAAQALEELALRKTFDGFTDVASIGGDPTAAGTVPCETIPSPHGPRAKDGQHRFKGGLAWTSIMEQFSSDQMMAAARAQAWQITAQVRRDADAMLAEARQQADRTAAACAEMTVDIERGRKQVSELLAEARREAESVRSEVAEIAEGARRSANEELVRARRQAMLLLDDARSEAAQIRGGARQSGDVSNRADTRVGGSLVREYRDLFAASLACTHLPATYLIPCWPWSASDGSARRLPVNVANDPDFRRRFSRKMATARQVRAAYTAELIESGPDGAPPWPPTLYVPGPSLTDAVAAHGPVPTMQFLAQLTGALQAAHTEDIVHRDLKPSNLLMADGGLRVTDFGMKVADGTSAHEEDAREGSEQTSTADARKNVRYAAVPCPPRDLLRLDRADPTCRAAAWADGARSLLGPPKADDADAGDDAKLGVEGARSWTGR
ncbi:protein kinase domain-containing protein [Streptomyces sp. NPDC054962]